MRWRIKEAHEPEDSDEDQAGIDQADPFGVFTSGGGHGRRVVRAATFTGHARWVTTACTQGPALFTGSTDTTVRRWELATGREEMVYPGHSQEVPPPWQTPESAGRTGAAFLGRERVAQCG